MMEHSVWAKSEHGFMIASATKERLLIQAMDFRGNILYKTELTK
jgi:hypothetical protein